jgi:hypothetical protein
MSRPAKIETPFPSLEETAHILGVPVSQAERVRRLLTVTHKNGRAKTKAASRRTRTAYRTTTAYRYAAKKASKKA